MWDQREMAVVNRKAPSIGRKVARVKGSRHPPTRATLGELTFPTLPYET